MNRQNNNRHQNRNNNRFGKHTIAAIAAMQAQMQQMSADRNAELVARSVQTTIDPTDPKAAQQVADAIAKIKDPRDADILVKSNGQVKIITSGTSRAARRQGGFHAIGNFARSGQVVKLGVEYTAPTFQALPLGKAIVQALVARFGDSSVGTAFGANDYVSLPSHGKTLLMNSAGENVATILAEDHKPAWNSFWFVGSELLTVRRNKVFMTSTTDATTGKPARYVGAITRIPNALVVKALSQDQFLVVGQNGSLGVLVMPKQGQAYSVQVGHLPQGTTFNAISKDGKTVIAKTTSGQTLELAALGAQLQEAARHLNGTQPSSQSRR